MIYRICTKYGIMDYANYSDFYKAYLNRLFKSRNIIQMKKEDCYQLVMPDGFTIAVEVSEPASLEYYAQNPDEWNFPYENEESEDE